MDEKATQVLLAAVALAVTAVAGYLVKRMKSKHQEEPGRELIDARADHKIRNAMQIHVEPLQRRVRDIRKDLDAHLEDYREVTTKLIEHIAQDDVRQDRLVRDLDGINAEMERMRQVTNGKVVQIATQMEMVLAFMERQERSREGREEDRARRERERE